jgi:hypothetical protein
MKIKWLVYWLYDPTCMSPIEDNAWVEHGYIGAAALTHFHQRMNQHRNSKRIPQGFYYSIIFQGSRKEALDLEAKLRPTPGIGWNMGVGGFANGKGLRGIPKSPEQREKMRQAALARYAKPGEKERTAKAVKRGLKNVDRTGANNPNFGKTTTEATKQLMRQRLKERGGYKGRRNPNYRHGDYVED